MPQRGAKGGNVYGVGMGQEATERNRNAVREVGGQNGSGEHLSRKGAAKSQSMTHPGGKVSGVPP